ncbi:MAG: Fe-S cluster assembly protein HesB [Candidatus Thorarchaeota archaeon]|nr:MAG: Fe-S cluster assembly protein HesB [Candidatus Thorarchaeota archaeon]
MDDAARKKATHICRLLQQNYGDTVVEQASPPIDELVMTILSQNTTDVNSQRAYDNLRTTYPTWEEVMSAPEDEMARVIRSSGYYKLKAKRIKAALSEIQRRVGDLDLSLLSDMATDDAAQWLTSLHGVGPKTAAIVLLFSFGRPTLPVDTHVWRVTRRLGLVPLKVSRENAQPMLESIIPAHCLCSLNHNLVLHGRRVCRARNPLCSECFLSTLCDWYASGTWK